MNHDEVCERCNFATEAQTGFERKKFKLSYKNIDFYISVAAANGLEPREILKLITENSSIAETKAITSINAFFTGHRKRPVWVDGKIYDSVVEAAKAMKKDRSSIAYMIEKGRAHYVKLAI